VQFIVHQREELVERGLVSRPQFLEQQAY